MDEEERDGLTVREILRVIFSQKWLALIIAAIITIGGTLGLYFGYNAANAEYTRIFTISIPGSDNLNPVFPDNSPFDYRDIISRENLVSAKAADEAFKDIDISTMYRNREISITRSTNQITSENIEMSYIVSVNSKYFSDSNQASDFIDELVKMPVNYLLGLSGEQDAYLSDYGLSNFYEDNILVLKNQLNHLQEGTDLLVTSTGNSSSIALLGKIKRFGSKLEIADADLRENLYVHNVEEVYSKYSKLYASVTREIEYKQEEIERIYGNAAGNNGGIFQPTERVEELAAEITSLRREADLYRDYVEKYGDIGSPVPDVTTPAEGSAEFAQQLAALKDELAALTDEYEATLSAYYSQYSLVTYDGALIMSGGINIIVCILISLIVGVIVAAAVSFFIGLKKRRSSNVQQAPSADGVQQE